MDKNILKMFIKDPVKGQKMFIHMYGIKPLMEFAKQMRDTYRISMAIPPVWEIDKIMWKIVSKLILKEVLTDTEKKIIPRHIDGEINRQILKGMWEVDSHVRNACKRTINGKDYLVGATIVRADKLPDNVIYGSKKLLKEFNDEARALAKKNKWTFQRPIDWLKAKYGENINLDDFRNHLGKDELDKPIV